MKKNKHNFLLDVLLGSKSYLKLKMIKNSIKRKSYYLKNHLHINNIETKIKIIWLKTPQMINDNLVKLNDLDYNLCYFINRQTNFNSYEFQIPFDIVIVNLFWEVVKMYPNFKPNNEIEELSKTHHIFVLATNSINALSLKVNDRICTMKKY